MMMEANKAKAVAIASLPTDDDASSGEAGGGGGPVEHLPLHLTEKILYSISPLASAHLVAVCKPWAATVSERLARPVPHLFVYLPPHHGSDRRGVVFSVSMHSGHPPEVIPSRVRLTDTNGLGCVGAMPSGRLAFANFCWCERSILLVNPITGARQRIDVDKSLRGNPVIAAGGADSFVAIGSGELTFWRRSGGEEWSKRSVAAGGHLLDGIMSVANCNGRFYILDMEGYVFLVDATAPPPLRIEKVPAASLFDRFAPPRPAHVTEYGHLLESGGEVLFVRRVLASKEYREIPFCRHGADEHLSVVGFEVYRLDVEGRRWTEVRKLAGDRALFVSPTSSFSVHSSETEGFRSNCIYFVDKKGYCAQCNRDDGNTWGVYSMEDRKLLFKQAITEQGACSSATWFLPRV
jgi:hypothetical protein